MNSIDDIIEKMYLKVRQMKKIEEEVDFIIMSHDFDPDLKKGKRARKRLTNA